MKKKNEQGFARHYSESGFAAVLIMLILAALVVLVSASYFFGVNKIGKNVNMPKPIVSPSPIASQATTGDMVNWKTYTSIDGKYEIRYPSSWSFKKYDEKLYVGHAIFDNTKENVFGEMKIISPEQIRGDKWSHLTLENFFDPRNDFWLVGQKIGGGPGTDYETPTETLIGSYKSMMQNTRPATSGYEGSSTNRVTNYFYIPISNSVSKLVLISFSYDNTLTGVDGVLKTFDQILSTFKFINNDSSNSKTYINEKYGYEFKCPITSAHKITLITVMETINLCMMKFVSRVKIK